MYLPSLSKRTLPERGKEAKARNLFEIRLYMVTYVRTILLMTLVLVPQGHAKWTLHVDPRTVVSAVVSKELHQTFCAVSQSFDTDGLYTVRWNQEHCYNEGSHEGMWWQGVFSAAVQESLHLSCEMWRETKRRGLCRRMHSLRLSLSSRCSEKCVFI